MNTKTLLALLGVTAAGPAVGHRQYTKWLGKHWEEIAGEDELLDDTEAMAWWDAECLEEKVEDWFDLEENAEAIELGEGVEDTLIAECVTVFEGIADAWAAAFATADADTSDDLTKAEFQDGFDEIMFGEQWSESSDSESDDEDA